MKVLRTLVGTAGLAVLGGAVALVVTPDLAGSIPVKALVELAGNDYLLLAVVGAAMVLAALLALSVRGVSGLDQATPPDPEAVQSAPRPGEKFDESIAGVATIDLPWNDDDRAAIRDRLFEAAVGVEMRRSNVTRAAAREAVDHGEWTDAAAAAAFLAPEGAPPSSGASGWLSALLRGETRFQYRARRTAAAIAAIHRGEQSPRAGSAEEEPIPAVTDTTAGGSGDRGGPVGASGVTDGGPVVHGDPEDGSGGERQ